MKIYSDPTIRRASSGWYVSFNFAIPPQLWEHYKGRKTKRFKIYEGINRFTGVQKEKNAKQLCQVWKYMLQVLRYNPFEEELKELEVITVDKVELKKEVHLKQELSEEEQRKLTSVENALDLFLKSRKERIKNTNTISTYGGTVKWLKAYFAGRDLLFMPISKVSRLQISQAILKAKEDKNWSGTTYNKQLELCLTAFNWFEREEYLIKNPVKGNFDKMRSVKTIHRWYDRDTAKTVKEALLKAGEIEVYRACQFTYHICIRSQSELMKLKVGDIDWSLKRIRFRSELSKSGREAFRDFTPEFEKVLLEMGLDKLPHHYYVFGRFGKPAERHCGKNTLASLFRPIREALKLPGDFTIYGWKHTRVVHEMMLGKNPYDIQHLCRHTDLQTTMDYMRDFDISLVNVYGPEDLTF